MKMYKTIPTFILLFTEIPCRYRKKHLPIKGYFGKNMHVAAAEPGNGTQSLLEISHNSLVTEPPESETATSGSNHVPEHLSATLVSGLSISFVVLVMCVIIAVRFSQKWSKERSAEINSAPSSEAVVTLKDIKT